MTEEGYDDQFRKNEISARLPVGRQTVRIPTGAFRSGIQPETLSRYRTARDNPRNRSFQAEKPA
ncbi:hypothetical protein [Kamptonema formosum]|uniref:hypothetical protein n=1 Tax=Kamptonema formosum TaxID=331992 RepID=UPI00034C93A6|nr:hypothetical protein [Oscillatoria sp. PCC 10802]